MVVAAVVVVVVVHPCHTCIHVFNFVSCAEAAAAARRVDRWTPSSLGVQTAIATAASSVGLRPKTAKGLLSGARICWTRNPLRQNVQDR